MPVNHSNKMTRSDTQNDDGNQEGSGTFNGNLFIIIAYSLIVLVSLCGNTLVLKVVASHPKCRTTPNLLIASLTTANLINTLNIPFRVTPFLFLNYPFSVWFCRIIHFIEITSVYVSMLTMVVMAIHRCATLKLIRLPESSVGVGSIIFNVWALRIFLAQPHALLYEVYIVNDDDPIQSYTVCQKTYPGNSLALSIWISAEEMVTQHVIPLGITTILYFKIYYAIKSQNNLRNRDNMKTPLRLMVIVLALALCWLPLNIYTFLTNVMVFFNIQSQLVNSNLYYIVCHWFAMSSVCYNPFIIWFWNERFRKRARKMLTCKRSSSSSSKNHNNIQLSRVHRVGLRKVSAL